MVKNAPLQPIISPRKLPKGAAMSVDSALPPFSMDRAFGTEICGTSLITVAALTCQNPPTHTPSKALPIISVSPFGANATIIPDIPIKTLKNKSMLFLSILPATEVKNSAVIRAKTPDTDML